jgi:subtilisin family serine protease
MATIYVIHDPEDRAFVESTLLTPLPSLGFDRWLSSDRNESTGDGLGPGSIESCAATVVVVSSAARRSETVRRETERALGATQPLIAVQLDQTGPESVATGLGALPKIDPGDAITSAAVPMSTRVRASLSELLPPTADSVTDAAASERALRIEWNEEVFSEYLQRALTHHDFNRGESLMTNLERHLRQRPYPYPAPHARNDLKALRRKRQFQLMGRYAEMVLASGTDDRQVRRQLAQSLIERGQFDEALPVLQGIVESASPDDTERIEASGLTGRLFKQKYVNDPADPSAPEWLRRSFEEYYSVYRNGPDNFWHGVNAASLLLRAHRDRAPWGSRSEARDIATSILKRLDELRTSGGLQVWDVASRIEAFIALDRFDDAAAALDEYLAHPDMDAFEVSSTFRQFDQVLQLGSVTDARAIYDRLWQAVDRYRAGGISASPPQREAVTERDLLPIVLRVSDPNWTPLADVRGLRISARLGTVISARASRKAVQSLLKDPVVIAIEESRQVVDVDLHECARGMPFIRISDSYKDTAGAFGEKGRHALIAFIDNGIDVLHQAFTDDNGQTRIVGIWDQRDQTGPCPAGFDYGTHHTRDDIQKYLAEGKTPAALGRNDNGHGTHVASIAAGRAVGDFFGGVAPESRLLVVVTKSDGDIGYSSAHLDALAFIDTVAAALGLPVVVNVSKGMNAGAHDGKSALEIGFEEFAGGGRKRGRVVVKSAGNERGQRGHAQFTVRTAERLRWTRKQQIPPWQFERLELWWNAGNALRFRLGSPAGAWSDWVSDATPDLSGTLTPGGMFHLQLTKRHIDNGDSQLRIDLGDPILGVMPGTWTLEILGDDVTASGPVHAWIARGGGTPSEFEDFINQDVTLTIPATSQSVITVGAVEASPTAFLGDFSSRGPTRDGRDKPDVVAPGVDVHAAKGGSSNGWRADSGTSMAAPHVAGAVALVLSRAVECGRPWPVANQIRSALTQKTKNYNGHFDPGQGYGIVDVAALLAAF